MGDSTPSGARGWELPALGQRAILRMKANPILEEAWRGKDELAREADFDLHRLFENTRQWAAQHPRTGPVLRSAEELRQFMAARERQRTQDSPLLLKDEPTPPKS